MDDLILSAITNLQVIQFTYNNKPRVCEPHIFGMANGQRQVLCFQTQGESKRGGIPEWRRFDLNGMENLQVTGDTFDGPRPIPKGPHSIWDSVILTVS